MVPLLGLKMPARPLVNTDLIDPNHQIILQARSYLKDARLHLLSSYTAEASPTHFGSRILSISSGVRAEGEHSHRVFFYLLPHPEYILTHLSMHLHSTA